MNSTHINRVFRAAPRATSGYGARWALAGALALALGACTGLQPAQPDGPEAAPQPAQPAGRDVVAIRYPDWRAGDAALRAHVEELARETEQEFRRAAADTRQIPAYRDREFRLQIHFEVISRLPGLVSVVGTGDEDTGGAHPIPLLYSTVWNGARQRPLTLEGLFMDAGAARAFLSDYARRDLQQGIVAVETFDASTSADARREWRENMTRMIRAGTAPTANNFRHFALIAGGRARVKELRLMFPAYQVTPYVYGMQVVNVPAAAIERFVRPEYRRLFAS